MVLAIAKGLVGGLTSGSAGKIQGLTPMGEMSTINNLPETKQIQQFAKLPNLKTCNESTALQKKKELETMKGNLYYMQQIAEAQKGKMDTAVQAIGTRLSVRQHGLKSAVKIADLAAKHRLEGLQAGYQLNEAKTVVSAWEQVSNQSASIIQL